MKREKSEIHLYIHRGGQQHTIQNTKTKKMILLCTCFDLDRIVQGGGGIYNNTAAVLLSFQSDRHNLCPVDIYIYCTAYHSIPNSLLEITPLISLFLGTNSTHLTVPSRSVGVGGGSFLLTFFYSCSSFPSRTKKNPPPRFLLLHSFYW